MWVPATRSQGGKFLPNGTSWCWRDIPKIDWPVLGCLKAAHLPPLQCPSAPPAIGTRTLKLAKSLFRNPLLRQGQGQRRQTASSDWNDYGVSGCLVLLPRTTRGSPPPDSETVALSKGVRVTAALNRSTCLPFAPRKLRLTQRAPSGWRVLRHLYHRNWNLYMTNPVCSVF